MNGRMYDAKLGRFLSPDNYIQEPFSTQSFNRYGYVWNNPLKFTDPSGEFFWVAVIIGAFIGGITAAINGGDFGDILLGALIGGVAGGLGAGVGNLVAGGAFIGGKAMAVVGFWNGALAGAAGGFAAGFSGAALNTWANGGNLGDGLAAGFKAGVQGALVGAAVGGITGGIRASKQGKGFWSGLDNSRPQVSSVSELTPYGVKKFANPKIEANFEVKYNPIKAPQSLGTRSGFDIDAAVETLNNNAHARSIKRCAEYVRNALESGGIETKTALNNLELTDAYKYEKFLPSKGFSKIGENTFKSYTPMKGDIMVFGNTSNHIHGHIQMYNGSNWVSDFVQRTPYPWRDYGNYSIFRW